MTRRPGVTLLEVLVTILIMGVGLVAVLSLFPLGAVYVASAVRQDRSHQLADSIDGYIRSYWKAEVVETPTGEWFFAALDEPDLSNTSLPIPAAHGLPSARGDDVSYPVVVDPMGWYAPRGGGTANPTASQYWIGDFQTNVPRRSLNQIFGDKHALRAFSMPDGLGYDLGRPTPDRELRYNALCVIQRKNNRSNRYAADITYVVFDRRAHLYAPAGVEEVFAANFQPGQTGVVVTGTPDIKPGGWVMDATVNLPTDPRPLIRHANFYQVTSVTPNGGNTILEFQVPVKLTTEPTGNTAAYAGTLVVFRGVSGVYPKPPLVSGQ